MTQTSPRKFQFLRAIASGGFGDVYLCKEFHSTGFSRLVAVKILRSKWSENEEIVARMRDEAKLLGLLRHRNIIKVHELTSLDKRTAVVMEYLDALDLGTIIEQMRNMRRRLPPRVSLEITATVAVALDAAYNQPPFPGEKPLRVIHRDIKPSNIMIDSTGLIKVLDFGVAQADFDTRESSTRELQFGSLEYMAPERLFFEPETPASDIYSLSASLFECLAAQKFGKASARLENHAERLEAQLRRVIARLKMSPEAKKELAQLLRSGLSFEGTYRLSAVEFAQRARMLARAIPGIDLVNWSEKAIPYIRNKLNEQIPTEGTLLHKIISEDSIVLRTPTPRVPSMPSDTDQDSLSRGALAELTLVDPTEHHFVGDEPSEAPTAQVRIHSEQESTLVTNGDTSSFNSEVTVEREMPYLESVQPTDEFDPLRTAPHETTQQSPSTDDATLELSHRTPLKPITEEQTTQNSSVTDIQKLHPKPTPMQTPNRPYTIEQNEQSGRFANQPGEVPPFPWKTLIGICISIFAGIIIVGYFFIQGMTDYVDRSTQIENTPEAVDQAVENAPPIDYPDGALVFQSKDTSALKVDATCGDHREKAKNYFVVLENTEPVDCEVTIYMGRRDRKKYTIPNVTNGIYICSDDKCLLESDE
ncbi:MAG: serine/threonine protein kinase [Myxococcota bacterium]